MTLEDEPTGMGASTADMVWEGITELGRWDYTVDAGNREEAYAEWQLLNDARATLIGVCHDLEAKIAESIPARATVEIGEHKFRRTTERRFVKWQNEDLVRAVLDSVLVHPETGEIQPETPAEKLADVYGLHGTQARLMALKARHLEPDEFAEVQWGRTKLRDVT